jgi:hypothetical protein
LTVHAVPGLNGRYAGSVGGARDGMPMTIDFCLQLVTDEWITGYAKSEVSAQGMVCKMSRDFEMRTDGANKEPDEELPVSAVFNGVDEAFAFQTPAEDEKKRFEGRTRGKILPRSR